MSDHPKEAERNLKRIRICNDIFFDVFRLLEPAKVGLELALVSGRFDALVDMQFKTRKWTLGKLTVCLKLIYKIKEYGPKKILPFPQKELPNAVVGFALLNIHSTNSADAMAFLRSIGRLFDSDVCLDLHIRGEKNWTNFATSIWPLLMNVSAIIKIDFKFPLGFYYFRHLISSSILCDCSNLRLISSNCPSLEFPPDDSKEASDGQALCKWLHTPRAADGQPKVLKWAWHWEADEFPLDALKTFF